MAAQHHQLVLQALAQQKFLLLVTRKQLEAAIQSTFWLWPLPIHLQ
jgi:hypothetical protein